MKPVEYDPNWYAVADFKVIAWGQSFSECAERAAIASGWTKEPGSVAPYVCTTSFIGLATLEGCGVKQ